MESELEKISTELSSIEKYLATESMPNGNRNEMPIKIYDTVTDQNYRISQLEEKIRKKSWSTVFPSLNELSRSTITSIAISFAIIFSLGIYIAYLPRRQVC